MDLRQRVLYTNSHGARFACCFLIGLFASCDCSISRSALGLLLSCAALWSEPVRRKHLVRRMHKPEDYELFFGTGAWYAVGLIMTGHFEGCFATRSALLPPELLLARLRPA